MYTIKQVPEDFVVEEITSLEFGDEGNYSYFLLIKRNMTTEEAVDFVSKKSGVDRKLINYAGTKDKSAVTTQLISINKKDVDIKNCQIEGPDRKLRLKFVGRGNQRINLGNLIGNRFEIVVRNLDSTFAFKEHYLGVPNYFDEQRFSKNNKDIGKLLLKKDFKEAVKLLIIGEGKYEESVRNWLKENRNDYVGAIRTIPKNILSMYIHSFQSYVFNETVAAYIKSQVKKYKTVTYSLGRFIFPLQEVKDAKIPVIGFGTELSGYNVQDIVEKILKLEETRIEDFVIRPIPELTCEGTDRNMMVDIYDMKVSELEVDELNPGKKKVQLKFELVKGCYATIVIKALFEN